MKMKTDINLNSKILIVDDEPFNLRIVTEILEESGFTNLTAESDPKEALRIFLKEKPDLVLLDLLMPEVSGKDFVSFLETKIPQHGVPILILTAVTDKKVTQYMLARDGVVDYLTKPFEAAELLARVRNILSARMNQKQLEFLVNQKTESERSAHNALIQTLARTAEFKDNETGAHIRRIGFISHMIAIEMGWSEPRCNMIGLTAPLHDLGKVGIPESVLLKNGPLSFEERKLMEKHTVLGAVLLMESGLGDNETVKMAINIALNHHEKWDGQSGYPRGISGKDIPMEARITAVADVFDALMSKRPYKQAWEADAAIDYIKSNSGKQFDPDVVGAFLTKFNEILIIREKHQDEFTDYMVRAKQFEQRILGIDRELQKNNESQFF